MALATAAALGMTSLSAERSHADPAPETPVETVSPEEARQVLRDYFAAHYSEGGCSAIYADLTHDGAEELLVLEFENDRAGEPIQLHSSALDPDRFTEGRVTVLRAMPDETVTTLYEYTCGSSHAGWGELYLQKRDGLSYLLLYTPYTSAGRSAFEIALFSLGDGGEMQDAARESVTFPVEEGTVQEGDADEAEIDAFLHTAQALLRDAKPLLVYDAVYDPVTETDGPRQFAYLDELFTTY
ncbi:MAG: hypothetical protein Q4C45_08725 [Oscillospiraceae bacterium]|nr:hypothetical protein [Oscillospiraceae bacterium]